jgi:hypothetical protein
VESVLKYRQLSSHVHFPFLTAQWKSAANNGTHEKAKLQGARDGATINYLKEIYKQFRAGKEPDVVEICHFSITVDMRLCVVWVHWSEAGTYHMQDVEWCYLKDESSTANVRAILRNLKDWALGERLEALRALLGDDSVPAERSNPSSANSAPSNVHPSPKEMDERGAKRRRGS